MPYIDPKERVALLSGNVETVGQLNYILTTIVKQYLTTKGERYATYNDIIGPLEGCKLEIYRRNIAPYEDKKIEQSGDVY